MPKKPIVITTIFVVILGIASWAFFSFFNTAIGRFLEFLADRFNLPILLDELMQNFIVVLVIIIILVIAGFGAKKALDKIING